MWDVTKKFIIALYKKNVRCYKKVYNCYYIIEMRDVIKVYNCF